MEIILTLLNPTVADCVRQFQSFRPSIRQFQVDIQDGKYVVSKAISLPEFQKALALFPKQDLETATFDFHLQEIDYERDLDLLGEIKKSLPLRYVFIHASLAPDYPRLKKRYAGLTLGLVFNPDDEIKTVADRYDISSIPTIQIMTINPGPQGQAFIPQALNKIDQLRSLDYRSKIYLDGAINEKTIDIVLMRQNKPDGLCVGSYFTRATDLKKRIRFLREKITTAVLAA
ncbi:hypothetical protein HY214_04645 [Candidatus Roizmanbacteria bacterium]|nr:hypothetical protein [Candidatus Roizmanbacteria bacterium]